MTSRWVFITSSYWSTFFRVWKFRDSTCFWAFSEHVFPGLEVPGLHLLLGVLDGVGEHLLLDGGVLVHPQLLHHAHDPLGAEEAHDVVLQGEVEPALAGVALTAGTAPQLVVDAAGLVTLGAQDEEAAHFPDLVGLGLDLGLVLGLGLGEHLPGVQDVLVVGLGEAGGLGDEVVGEAGLPEVVLGQELGVAAQHDVGTTAGHVGGHGDGAELAGLGHDLGFLLVVLGVEDVVLHAGLLQKAGEELRLLDGHGAHQHGLALLVALLDLVDDGPVLAHLVFVDHVVVVDAGQGLVGGDLHHVQGVGAVELVLLGHGGARHAGELVVEAEVVLEGDGGQGLGLPGHGDALLSLDGLVKALGIAAAEHETAGELVHDDDLAVLDHVVDVPLHEAPGPDGLVDVVGEGGVLGIGQVLQVEGLLRLGDAVGGQGDGAGLLVHDIVGVLVGVLLLLGVHAGHHLALEAGDEVVQQELPREGDVFLSRKLILKCDVEAVGELRIFVALRVLNRIPECLAVGALARCVGREQYFRVNHAALARVVADLPIVFAIQFLARAVGRGLDCRLTGAALDLPDVEMIERQSLTALRQYGFYFRQVEDLFDQFIKLALIHALDCWCDALNRCPARD